MRTALEALDLQPEGLDRTSELLQRVFPEASYLTADFLQWSYGDNPDGKAVGFNAIAEGQTVAHYATQPLLAEIGGHATRGLLSLHTATHPEFQGRGLFPQLAGATYERAREAGYRFVIGVANAASTPGFVRKLGFQNLGPLEARLSLGRLPRPGAEYEISFSRIWSPNSLKWRLASPRQAYRLEVEPDGFRVHAELGRFGSLVELAFLSGQSPRKLEGPGLRPLRLFVGLDPRRCFGALQHPPLPKLLHPSPLNLIFLDLDEPERTLEPGRILFQALDFDAW